MAVTSRTIGSGNDSTLPNGTQIAAITSNAGDVNPVVSGYVDGSNDFQSLSTVDGVLIRGTATLGGAKSGTKAVTTASDSTTSATLIASNADRTGFSIVNTSSARLYVAAGGTASATNLFVALSQWQECSMYGIGVWTGDVTGVWATDPGDGVAVCTEFEE